MIPGLCLRQVREKLGLTYRDVERSSFELAAQRGRSEFILHISRLADIENHGVVPSLHKIYTLAVVYHLNPLDIFRWYEVPIDEFFGDGAVFHTPQSHLMAPPASLRIPVHFDPSFDPNRTEFLSRMVEKWGRFEGALTGGNDQHRYGYIGLNDRRMMPLLRPGKHRARRCDDAADRRDRLGQRIRPADVLCRDSRRLPLRLVPPGWIAAGDAAASTLALPT